MTTTSIQDLVAGFILDLTQTLISNLNVCLRDEDASAKIEDPDALKPEGWLDDEAEFVPDPNAEKPEDW